MKPYFEFALPSAIVRSAALALAFLAVTSGSGCALVRRGAMGMIGPATGGMTESLYEQSDTQLVREGAPAWLLLFDGLAKGSPDNAELLLAAAEANLAYAGAFLERADPRALAMYRKALDYSLAALRRNRVFRRAEEADQRSFEKALASLRRKEDARALYAAGMAWTGVITSDAGSIRATAGLPKATALMRRALDLDPGCQNGGPHLYFGVYHVVQPRGAGQDFARARMHFERAMEFAGPDYLLPRLAFAEYYCRYTLDRELFEKTLKAVVGHETRNPRFRLMNEVARQRARRLMDNADELF